MRALTLALFTTGCIATATFEPVDDTAPDDPVDPNVVYEARLLATALDRMWLARVDPTQHSCAFVTMAAPMDRLEWAIDLDAPDGWTAEWGGGRDGLDCDPQVQLPTTAPVRTWGWIDWEPAEWGLPGTIYADLWLELDDGSDVHFVVEGLEPTW